MDLPTFWTKNFTINFSENTPLNNILRKYELTDFVVNYIDDILIFSKFFSEYINHLTQLLKAIKKESFRLKFTKYTLASDSVQYLGYTI